jgi:hypothetical protein
MVLNVVDRETKLSRGYFRVATDPDIANIATSEAFMGVHTWKNLYALAKYFWLCIASSHPYTVNEPAHHITVNEHFVSNLARVSDRLGSRVPVMSVVKEDEFESVMHRHSIRQSSPVHTSTSTTAF